MLKSIVLGFVLLLNVTSAYAFVCVNKETGVWVNNGDNVDVYVPLDSDLVSGESANSVNEYADVDNFFYCFNQAPDQYTDFLFMESFTTPLNPNSEFGIQIKGVNYFGSLPSETLVLEFPQNDAATFPLPLKLILRVTNRPGDGIFIKKGDILLVANMHKYAYTGDSTTPIDDNYFKWTFRAGNDVILSTGTCNINDGQIILVEMGELYRSRIASPGAGQSSMGVREVPLTYQCNNDDNSIDSSYTQNIKIYLSAIASSFSSGAVETKTGNSAGGGEIIPGLGIEFYHKESNKLLNPSSENGYFNTSIVQGVGKGDTLIVAPVQKVGATVADVPAGEFNAVATLIMTLP